MQANETQENLPQDATSYRQLFDQALVLQQQKNWDGSLEIYQKLLDQSREDSSINLDVFQAAAIYHNMSSIAYQKGDFLKAYVWSRKSLALNPSSQLAQDAYAQYSKKFEVPVVARQITNFEQIKMILAKTPVDMWLFLSLALTLLSVWLVLKNIITTKKNQAANKFDRLSKAPAYFLIGLTFIVLSIAYIRYLDSSTSRGIVIAEKAQVQTTPGENKSIIFEAQAGLELEVLKFDQGYYQVRYPGAFSGWINGSQIEVLSLSFKHEK